MVELLALPLAACVLLVAIHCQFGLQVLRRNVVFVDLALAQSAALGSTVAFMQGHLPQTLPAYAWSLGFAWGAALLLSLIRLAPARIPPEALVGVLYVAAAAAAMLLIERAPQGAEHLQQVLTGSVLTVGADEWWRLALLYAPVAALLAVASRRGWLERQGLAGWVADLGFYAAFGLVVTSSVSVAGVLLVFSFLIIPALVGLAWARTPGRQWWVGTMAGTAASAAGLGLSYGLDSSTGATLVCTFALVLALALIGRLFARGSAVLRPAARAAGAFALTLLLASTTWLALQPRADQPLLDAAEAAWPALRAAYFNAREREVYADATRYVQRYTAEIERLTAIESRSRWQDGASDDEKLRKIASFQQSYNEMIKGERFVMREMLARARERLRLPAAMVALGALAILAVWFRPWRWLPRRGAARQVPPANPATAHPAQT